MGNRWAHDERGIQTTHLRGAPLKSHPGARRPPYVRVRRACPARSGTNPARHRALRVLRALRAPRTTDAPIFQRALQINRVARKIN